MKFEYKILSVSREHMKKESFQTEMLEKFNAYGEDGWEIISAEGMNGSSMLWHVAETTEVIFIFKRANHKLFCLQIILQLSQPSQ